MLAIGEFEVDTGQGVADGVIADGHRRDDSWSNSGTRRGSKAVEAASGKGSRGQARPRTCAHSGRSCSGERGPERLLKDGRAHAVERQRLAEWVGVRVGEIGESRRAWGGYIRLAAARLQKACGGAPLLRRKAGADGRADSGADAAAMGAADADDGGGAVGAAADARLCCWRR